MDCVVFQSLYSLDGPVWTVLCFSRCTVRVTRCGLLFQSLYSQDDPVWTELRRPLHLLQAISWIIARFSERPDTVAARDRYGDVR